MNDFYIPPQRPDEIYHFGVSKSKGAKVGSGRYPLGSGDRPFQRKSKAERKALKKDKWTNRVRNKLDKYDTKKAKKQAVANKQYEKAVRKSNSLFGTKKAVDKAYEKADKAQRKVNRLDYKSNKYYQKYTKKFSRNNFSMSIDVVNRGKKYYENVVNNSKAAYMQRVIVAA